MDVTTPSVQAALASDHPSTQRLRPFHETEYGAVDGSVTHGPLYFEDGFEDGGGEDGKLAWSETDYLQWMYWNARFLVNVAGLPFSMVVHPPWTEMVSDGVPDREWLGWRHDARVASREERAPSDVTAESSEDETPSGAVQGGS